MKKLKILPVFMAVILIICFAVPVFADEDVTTADTETTHSNNSVIEVYDYNDLLKIKDDPTGTYKLMADIDLADVMWEPLNFQGTLDGNGHAFLNVTVNQTTSQTRKTYDGNMVDYDTCFSGFFGILENATISNLKILGIKININSDKECFVGGVAGFMEQSRISDVEIEGEAVLYTTGKCFGIGGFAGFGNGQIENSKNDMTLVCVDEDVENKDEQFMGGAYAAGYIDLNKNDVTIHGYDSDHGYVHNGGLIGMYVLYPADEGYKGFVTNNKVSGGISFFEDNEDRRAYCEPVVGEVMNWTFVMDGNEDDFTADEHFEYDFNLLPHDCTDPEYQDVITPATHTDYGFTTHSCTVCGEYSYISDYTAPEHEVEDWTVTSEPTAEEEGLRQGSCKECGTVVFERIAKVTSEEAEVSDTVEDAAPENKSGSAGKTILIIVIIIVVIIAVWLIYVQVRKAQIRKAKARKRAAQQRAARQRAAAQNRGGSRPVPKQTKRPPQNRRTR